MILRDLDFIANDLLPLRLELWKILYWKHGHFSIMELWEKNLRRNPQNTFLKGEDYQYSYSEFDRLINHVAVQTSELGLAHTDKVAVIAESVPNCVVHILAFLKLGIIPVLLRPSSTETQFRSFLSDHKNIKFVFGTEEGLARIPSSVRAHLGQVALYSKMPEAPAKAARFAKSYVRPEVIFSDVAFHVGTSGSTGHSKSVAVHHGALLAFVRVHQDMKDLNASDVLYGMASLSHGDGLAIGVFTPMTRGAALFLDETFSFETFVEKCGKHRVTIFSHIGTTPRKLLQQPKSEAERSFRLRV